MKEIGIGILGFGTVGAGVVHRLQTHAQLISERAGTKIVLRGIADLDLKTDRGVRVPKGLLTRDAEAVIHDPRVDIVVELVGGTNIARKFILQALALGKPVVTANKALLAEHGGELFNAAARHGTDIWFEASVGGGIPIIRALREGLIVNRIDRIYGILNGTCNYILSRMDAEGLAFDAVLKEAQAAGYAEADPGLDIDGHDTAHKAAVLASLAYGAPVSSRNVHVEGIRHVAQADIAYARDLGYRLKLLAVIKSEGGRVSISAHPALVPTGHMLASVSGVFNAVMVDGDVTGQTLYYGRGAGRYPTAGAVISDIAEAAAVLASGGLGARRCAFGWSRGSVKFSNPGDAVARYYLRVSLLDKPGTLGKVAAVLGKHGVSIASVVQKEERAGKHVPVVLITHSALERNFRAAIRGIDRLATTGTKTVAIRIEDL